MPCLYHRHALSSSYSPCGCSSILGPPPLLFAETSRLLYIHKGIHMNEPSDTVHKHNVVGFSVEYPSPHGGIHIECTRRHNIQIPALAGSYSVEYP